MSPEFKISRIEGRVPLDDMKYWLANLGHGRDKLNQKELEAFFINHLANAVALFKQDGMNKYQVREAILKEVTADGNKPTETGLQYIDKAINLAFE